MPVVDEIGLDKRTESCYKMYDNGYIPLDTLNATFIRLPKKLKAVNWIIF